MKKKIISIGLSTSMLMGGVALATETENKIIPIAEKVVISEQVQVKSNFTNYRGKIRTITREAEVLTITVDAENKDNSHKAMTFIVTNDSLVLTDKTQGDIERRNVVEGMTVEMFYDKDSAMTKSIPPIVNAKVLVVKELEEPSLGLKVDTFNKNIDGEERLVSVDNYLALNITEKTVIVDKDGKKITEKDLVAKDLVVFYGPATTTSIPAQSNAVKIIVLGERAKVETPEKPEVPEKEDIDLEIKSLDKISINGKQISLKNKMYKSGKVIMMPVRELAENLGYKVSWNGKTKQVELIKGANYVTLTANQDIYSFSKMMVKLGKASENSNGRIFVPITFIEEVMQLEMQVTKDGIVNIK